MTSLTYTSIESKNRYLRDKNQIPQWISEINPDSALLQGRSYRVAKRVFDFMIVVLASPFWLFLMTICTILIKFESPKSPVIFIQRRTGKGGKRFDMFKFRTMVENAEELKEKYKYLNELTLPDFKITNDPRITRVGRFLRKTSLDEFPQFINVLRGEMSLVGPRPTSFKSDTYDLWQTERLDTIPGVTGLWQLLGRGNTEFDERLRLDVLYISRQCIWFDIQILLRTFEVVINQRGAY